MIPLLCTITLTVSSVYADNNNTYSSNKTYNIKGVVNYNRGTIDDSAQYELKIDKDANATNTHVELLPDDNGKYWIPKGYKVKVSVDCNDGYIQVSDNTIYTMDNPRTVSINTISTNATPLSDVFHVDFKTTSSSVIIKWFDPYDIIKNGKITSEWAGTKLVKKEESIPTSVNDGELIVDETIRNQYSTTGFIDTNLNHNTNYYYRFFPYTTNGNIINSISKHLCFMPNGSTITPTNDIQTWLLCAGITDKLYTNILEVLADQTTLARLVSNDNACDYLVRSTEWINNIITSQIGMNAIGASDYCTDLLSDNKTWATAIGNSQYITNVWNSTVPIMTSSTTPSGIATSNSIYVNNEGYGAWRAFSGTEETPWAANTRTNIGDSQSGWIQYKFDNTLKCYQCSFKVHYGSGMPITAYEVKGSNDGTNFTSLKAESSTNLTEYNAILDNIDKYLYYRLDVTQYNNVGNDVGTPNLLKVQYYGRTEAAGIQDWLKTANIADKNYLTLAEVLIDNSTLQRLMNNHDAVDYLVKSTSWINAICNNRTAMKYIGANNYCADTLLNNDVWRTAICDSPYFESVLNIKIPVMTSNTTPSGTVYSEYTAADPSYAYQSFDGNSSTYSCWSKVSQSETLGGYVQYTFDNYIKPYKCTVNFSTSGTYYTGTLSGCVEIYDPKLNTWIKIGEDFVYRQTSSPYSFNIQNPIITNKVKAKHTSVAPWAGGNAYVGLQIRTLQIYGRAKTF